MNSSDEQIRRTEQQVKDESDASPVLIVGSVMLFFDVLLFIFVPADWRAGGWSVLLLAVAFGIVGIALVGAALHKRRKVQERVIREPRH